jgi:hypothetical protein
MLKQTVTKEKVINIVNNIITLCDFLGLDYTVEENLETYNNNA